MKAILFSFLITFITLNLCGQSMIIHLKSGKNVEYPLYEIERITYSSSITEDETSFKDSRDGHIYKIVRIGNQIWMAENLALKVTQGCWAYNNIQANATSFGYLYNWGTAKNICPNGWKLPSDEDWIILEKEIGMTSDQAYSSLWRGTIQGKQLKSISGWSYGGNGDNSSGFKALSGGYRNPEGQFVDIGSDSHWWASTENGSDKAWSRAVISSRTDVHRNIYFKNYGFFVRCIKE